MMDRRRSSTPLPDPRAWKDVDELFAKLVTQFNALKTEYTRLSGSHAELLIALKIAANVMEAFEIGVDPEIRAAIKSAEAR